MITIIECPICKSTDLKFLTRCEDFTVSHETFEIRQCNNCTLGITFPQPESSRLGDYYQSEEYVSHSGKTSGGIGFIYKLARTFTLSWKRGTIHRFKKTGSILDFGCGTGEFLNAMQNSGWKITGVEPSDTARSKAESLTKQKIHSTLEPQENYFDIVTAWHVVEHVPNLPETILKLKGSLKKDGILFIAVPNFQSPDGKHYMENWAGFDVPRHLWHFSKKSMNTLLLGAGLKLIDTIPMKLDAYYVSLLSEKYKNKNKLNVICMIKGFINGMLSNIKARPKSNYSSLIYIAKFNEV
jgi:2-polyprenyl-3-methyl-5-hydroxy-6-metoxy-1,4-benzoquinol methylase